MPRCHLGSPNRSGSSSPRSCPGGTTLTRWDAIARVSRTGSSSRSSSRCRCSAALNEWIADLLFGAHPCVEQRVRQVALVHRTAPTNGRVLGRARSRDHHRVPTHPPCVDLLILWPPCGRRLDRSGSSLPTAQTAIWVTRSQRCHPPGRRERLTGMEMGPGDGAPRGSGSRRPLGGRCLGACAVPGGGRVAGALGALLRRRREAAEDLAQRRSSDWPGRRTASASATGPPPTSARSCSTWPATTTAAALSPCTLKLPVVGIAETLGLSANSVKTHMQRGLRALEVRLEVKSE